MKFSESDKPPGGSVARILVRDFLEAFVKIAHRVESGVHRDIDDFLIRGEDQPLRFIDTEHGDQGTDVDSAFLLEQ